MAFFLFCNYNDGMRLCEWLVLRNSSTEHFFNDMPVNVR